MLFSLLLHFCGFSVEGVVGGPLGLGYSIFYSSSVPHGGYGIGHPLCTQCGWGSAIGLPLCLHFFWGRGDGRRAVWKHQTCLQKRDCTRRVTNPPSSKVSDEQELPPSPNCPAGRPCASAPTQAPCTTPVPRICVQGMMLMMARMRATSKQHPRTNTSEKIYT